MDQNQLENTENQNVYSENQTSSPVFSETRAKEYLERLRMDQNLLLGFGAGLGAALVGAVLWAVITVAAKYQIGYMAIGIGFIVGYSNRYLGKGMDKIFGVMGGALALFGCILGNFLSLVGFSAQQENVSYFQIFQWIDYANLPNILIENGSFMDLLFYAIAIYEGYRFSFRVVTEEELWANSSQKSTL